MKTIKLDYPVLHQGEEIRELKMRRCKVRDRRLAEKSGKDDDEKEIALISNLCEVSRDVIDELDFSDYLKLQETLSGFLSLKSVS